MLFGNALAWVVWLWMGSSAMWLLAMWYVLRNPDAHERLRPWLLILATVIIAAAAPWSDVMSDDALRYHWDGHVVAHGVNPYAHTPNSPALQWLAVTDPATGTRYPDAVTYSHIRTIYPPGAQLLVGAISWIAGVHTLWWKLTWMLIVTAMIITALRLLWHNVHRSVTLLMVLLCPTVILHGFVDIHFDMIMALLVLLGLIAADRRRMVAAGVLLGMAISVKYVAVLLLPLLLLSMPRKHALRCAMAALATVGLITLPFASASMFDAFRSFATTWQSNALLYSSLVPLIPEPGIRYVLAGIGIGMGLVVLWRRMPPVAAGGLIIVALLIVSPVVHPWYLLTPLLIAPYALLRSGMVWGATVSLYGLAYIAYKGDGVWIEDTVTLVVQVLPVVVAWTYDVARGAVTASAQDA